MTSPEPSSQASKTNMTQQQQRTWVLRVVFVVCLLFSAAFCGVVSYWVVDDLEQSVGMQTYESVASSALQNAKAITLRKVQGGEVMASVMKYAFPDSSQWPMVSLDGYVEIASKIAKLSSSLTLAVNVFVQPAQVDAFHEHAKQVYEEQGYPEGAGVSDFGFGTWKPDQSEEPAYPDRRLPDVTGETTYDSPNNILIPIFLHNNVNATSLLLNVHSRVFQGVATDSMLECAQQHDATNTNKEEPVCTMVTDFLELIIRPGPAAIIYNPVFAKNDPNTMVAITGTTIHWEEVLTSVVPDYVDGLDCVVSTDTESYTFVIDNGQPRLVGKGDHHDPQYEHMGRSEVLNDFGTEASASKTFTLTVYPTNAMLDEFRTNSPTAIAMGFVGVILFCAALFFSYDFFMRGESRHQKAVLEIKRRFVRFVSHEIRTPLNTVCMGLELLRSELDAQMDATEEEREKPPDNLKEVTSAAVNDGGSSSLRDTLKYMMDLTGDILDNSESAVAILNDLLNYDKIETGSFQLEVGIVPIWELVRKSVSAFDIQARKRNVALNFTLEQHEVIQNNDNNSAPGNGENNDVEKAKTPDLNMLNVIGDDMRLRQVILNLVSNALKFVEENNGVIDVKASFVAGGLPGDRPLYTSKDGGGQQAEPISYPREGAVKVSVRDNGEGMTAEQLHLLFREGVQFDANKLQAGGGSGLGLYITKGLIEQHGGVIRVESPGRGHGTTFTVFLPLYHCQSPTEPDRSSSTADTNGSIAPGVKDANDSADKKASSSPPRDSLRKESRYILVVDDAAMNRKMLIRLLQRAGHTCDSAANGQEAVDAVLADQERIKADEGHTPFDTILMDFEMPVLNGPDATKVIRSHGCDAFIVGVTGNVLLEDVNYFKSKGADHVLAKPLKVTELNEAWVKFKR
ncbi:Hybrid signal transduction histidine kinase K [Seminavis robusta]|uniref:histidine kinase n=1 Tax=Seminavis robusta TaxID=568900 RepID=A0A9N8HG96_9STRA|nr:Hybrid signal transduction histidine kinase K [Seminavis robusta]|eukprot:Sro498_g154870.1 Hybrid signal transduction histidine kinase K (909) ;mRNA; r:3562-6644